MFGLHEDEYALEQVALDNVVLDVVGVVLDAEG